MIIGITGKYCAGKNTVAQILVSSGFTEIDVDKIGHELLKEKQQIIINLFGENILGSNGNIDRKKLGKIVFANKKQRIKLEQLLHPLMNRRIEAIIKKNPGNYTINAALLFKMGLNMLCDFIIFVKAPFFIRLKRARERDNLSTIDAIKRFFAQHKISPKLKDVSVDIYYESNVGPISRLKKRVVKILETEKTKRK